MKKQLRLNLGAGLHHSCAQAVHYGCTVVRPLRLGSESTQICDTQGSPDLLPHTLKDLFICFPCVSVHVSEHEGSGAFILVNLFNLEKRHPVIIYLYLHLQSLAPQPWTSGENKEIGGLAGPTPRTSLSPTPRLVLPMMLHPSQGHSRGQECDPPQIPQGFNELHIVLRLGTRRSSWALLAVLPPAALQAYRVTLILGQRRPPGST